MMIWGLLYLRQLDFGTADDIFRLTELRRSACQSKVALAHHRGLIRAHVDSDS